MNRSALTNIYGGKNPGDVPLYIVAEVAHYLRLPNATVRSWALGRQYPTQAGDVDFLPLINVADPTGPTLSFMNLAELHILGSIRRAHKVKLPAVRKAIDYLHDRFRSDHPLLDRQMLTNGTDLFIEQYEHFVNISQHGQMVMSQIMGQYLKRIKRDREGVPIRLFPFTRVRYAESPEIISIDPKIRFGKPCITGTRIPTAIILKRTRRANRSTYWQRTMAGMARKSKKPSGTKADWLLNESTFFVDRCLGKHVGFALRQSGLQVEFQAVSARTQNVISRRRSQSRSTPKTSTFRVLVRATPLSRSRRTRALTLQYARRELNPQPLAPEANALSN